jgi:excinuclease ABC subunit A
VSAEAVHDLLTPLAGRLQFLGEVGVGYLSLDRPLRTLGGGERQRVALTRALGTSLVNVVYVLDEPSRGLHPRDVERLVPQIHRLSARRNTVVVVEHNAAVIRSVPRVVEIGPGAGKHGGEIVFDGSPEDLASTASTVTGQFLAGQRGYVIPGQRRQPDGRRLRLTGARGNNLRNVNVDFPLGMFCVVTGVSGSGKSSLVRQTLAPAVQQALGVAGDTPLPHDRLSGTEGIDEVAVIDQRALARVSRSNPATSIKAFDEIRRAFAESPDARARGMKPGHFSFNVTGGRCDKCQGEGWLTIDMQFMADVLKRCDECHGTRFKPSVLEVKYRDRNISDVLSMTVEEAFGFFRGRKRVQSRLKLLIDAGLGYIELGQPVGTMSIGEAQRLRLASFLATGSSRRTLFVMDEPTSGLHPVDVLRLIESFNALIDVGHSLIVIEHNTLMMAHADHVIDIGPGPADDGGQIVATGTPEQVAASETSITASYLAPILASSVKTGPAQV